MKVKLKDSISANKGYNSWIIGDFEAEIFDPEPIKELLKDHLEDEYEYGYIVEVNNLDDEEIKKVKIYLKKQELASYEERYKLHQDNKNLWGRIIDLKNEINELEGE